MYRVTRTSGRNLDEVRRSNRKPARPLTELKKDELVEVAESQGVDASGTKAEIIERLTDG